MHHILIIDDSEFDRRMIKLAFEPIKSQLEFTELAHADNVLKTMAELSPVLTFLDIRMPGKSGFDILSDIQSDKALKQHNVILVSGSDADCDRRRAKDLGAVAYFKKPHTRKDYKNIADIVEKKFLRKAA